MVAVLPLAMQAQTTTFDFESGDLSQFTNDESHPWVVSTDKNHTEGGTTCIKSGNAGVNSSTSSIEFTTTLASGGTISFYCWASCESASYEWDYGVFYIDGQEQEKFLHVTDWAQKSYDVAAGAHTFKWTFSKDASSAGGDDCLYVDDIVIDIPTCSKPTGLNKSNVTHNSAVLSWTAGTETSWALNVNGTLMPNITENPYTLSDLTPGTLYTVKVRANCSAEDTSEWTPTVSFTTKCEANTSFPWREDFENFTASSSGVTLDADCWENEHISGGGSYLFQVYSGTQGTNTTKQLRLPDMTSGTQTKLMLPGMSLPEGVPYEFQIDVYRNVSGTSYPSEGVRVYASTDGEIEGATELGFLYRNYTQTDGNVVVAESASGWYTYEFPIPFDGRTCYIVLRGESSYGSATYMDNLVIKKVPTCLKPTEVAVVDSTITTNSAVVKWTDNNTNDPANGWTLLVNDREVYANENPFTLTNLTPSTAYTVTVRANCSEVDSSEWSDVSATFTTECEIFNVTDSTPYQESFDGTTFPPVCWTRAHTQGSATSTWIRTTTASNIHTGAGAAQLQDQQTGNKNNLVTGQLHIPAADAYQVSFWVYRGANYQTKLNEGIKVWVNTTPDTVNGTEIMYIHRVYSLAPAEEAAGWYNYVASIPTSGDLYVIFEGISEYGTATNMDDISVEIIPSCFAPTALHVDTVTATTVTMHWIDNNEDRPASWTVSYANSDTTITVTATDTVVTIENLDPETAYTAKVRANCGAASSSAWSQLVNFTTTPTCLAPTNLIVSGVAATTATLKWTAGDAETQWILVLNNEEILVDQNPLTIDTLTSEHRYTAVVRAFCSADDTSYNSNTVTFNTTPVPEVVGESWMENFENNPTWGLVNGTLTNAWVIDTTVNNGGSRGLYISNNGGAAHLYTVSSPTVVYATKCLQFSEGSYTFEYDWLVNGESSYDFMRVALVPASVQLTASTDLPSGLTYSTLPSNWIDLDGGSKLNLVTEWQNMTVGKRISDGVYYLVFVWRNDQSVGTQPPAAVDNIKITRLACSYVAENLAVASTPAVTTNTATLTWTGDASQWQVAYSTNSNFVDSLTTMVDETDTTVSLTNLSAATLYYVKVRANCGDNGYGIWSNAISFLTECEESITIDETNSFEDGFEMYAGSTFPTCWTKETGYTASSTAYPYVGTVASNAHSGSKYMYMYFYGASASNLVSTPAFTNEMNTLQVRFFAKYSTNALFVVGVMDGSTFEPVDTVTLTSNYAEYTVMFNHYTGNGDRVAFKISPRGTATSGTIYLDDVTVELLPSCIHPDGIVISNISTTSATISWNDNNNTAPQSWTLEVNGQPISGITENPYTLTGLTVATSYTVRVKANCTDSDESEWSEEESFVTDCDVMSAVGYSEDFTGYATTSAVGTFSVLPTCWSDIFTGTNQGYRPHVYNGSYAVNSSDNALVFTGGGATYGAVNYAIMPEFEEVNGFTFSFSYRMENTSYGTLSYGYITDVTDATTFTSIGSVTSSTTAADEEATLANVPAGARLAFKWDVTAASYWSCSIDDISLVAPVVEPCDAPTNVAVNNGVVTWTGDAANYNVHIVSGETVIDTTVNTTSYTIEGLNEGDHATVTVQAICDEDNLSEWSEAVEFDYTIVGVNNYSINANIFPNPTTGNVTVESSVINADITVFDMFGKLMMTVKVAAARTELDFSGFAPGVYTVRIANSNAVTTVKVVKE